MSLMYDYAIFSFLFYECYRFNETLNAPEKDLL